uniref:Peptidase S1 domain-containing protein n=1 Tax=Panagrolaimus sp. JU765 TaxID=591449 RepID=A0AC34RR42_9BILA
MTLKHDCYLRWMQTTILNFDICKYVYGKFIKSHKHACIGDTLKNIADGDSGGPMLVFQNDRWYQVGITSFGHKNTVKGWPYPSVFARTSRVCDWIAKVTKNITNCVNLPRDKNYDYGDYVVDKQLKEESKVKVVKIPDASSNTNSFTIGTFTFSVLLLFLAVHDLLIE